MYEDIYGVTDIIDEEVDNLSVSIDNHDGPIMSFLYTPWMKETKVHYHIPLNKEKAIVLRDWINKFLEDDIDKKLEVDLERNIEISIQRKIEKKRKKKNG